MSGKSHELGASFTQLLEAVLVGHGQRGCHGLHVEVLAQDTLADRPQPAHAVPLGSDKEVLDHRLVAGPIKATHDRQRVRVGEVDQRLERLCRHVSAVHGDLYLPVAARRRRVDVALEKARRPSVEDAVVRGDRLSCDFDDHVRFLLAVAGLLEERQAGGRWRVVEGEAVAADVDGALDLEAVAEDVPRAGMEVAPPGELAGAPGARVLAAGVEQDRSPSRACCFSFSSCGGSGLVVGSGGSGEKRRRTGGTRSETLGR